ECLTNGHGVFVWVLVVPKPSRPLVPTVRSGVPVDFEWLPPARGATEPWRKSDMGYPLIDGGGGQRIQ
ncbi:hypothetical protein ACWDE0_33560, partial [Streptomyces sp. 900105755]